LELLEDRLAPALYAVSSLLEVVPLGDATAAPGRPVVFVEPNVPGALKLLSSVGDGADGVLLDGQGDGLAEMRAFLAGRADLAAVHLLSHGGPGGLDLGALWLSGDGLAGRAGDLAALGAALAPGGVLEVYGCEAAAGPKGAAFVGGLAAASGRGVAAATHVVGPARLGGDWGLDFQVGEGQALALPADASEVNGALGTISTVAGNGTAGFSGDGGPATSAQLDSPGGVAVDGAGNLFIADTYNSRVRKVSAAGVITTVAGNGTAGFSGDGGPPTSAQLNHPGGVVVDGAGNLFIADTYSNRVRKVAAGVPPSFTNSSPAPATFGSPYSYQFQATGDPAAVTYSASGLPAWATLSPTTGDLRGTPTAAGMFSFAVTASNGISPAATVSVTLTVNRAPLTITADDKARVAGTSVDLTATYTGLVNDDTPAVSGLLLSTYTGDTAGTYPITATGATATNYTITLLNGTLTVTPAGASTLSVTGLPASSAAGSVQTLTVTAYDAYGNVATGYTGTVTFSSSDDKATLPADYPFTSADAGMHTFAGVTTLVSAGSQTVTATDTATSSITGAASVTVNPAAAAYLVLSYSLSPVKHQAWSLTVTAYDAYGNVATGYTGTVTFSSSDDKATLPADYPFTAADAGTHTFSVTFHGLRQQSLTVTDTLDASISGMIDVLVHNPGKDGH
jgi:hypothetical protein